jgi:hypothetical protein
MDSQAPETVPQFSRRTVLAAIDFIVSCNTHASLTRYLQGLGQEVEAAVRVEPASKATRLTDLIRFVDRAPAWFKVEGKSVSQTLVEDAVSLLPPPFERPTWFTPEEVEEQIKREAQTPQGAFRRALQLDGFLVTDGALRRELPIDVGLPGVQSEIDRLLAKHGFSTPKGHLDQALDGHARGNWAAANSQIRAFFDALLDQIAEKLDASVTGLPSGQARRGKLAALGFLSRDLNEWADNGTGFINGLVKRLHPQGAHPGLSDKEDSTFRLHVILLTARLLLTRFDAQVVVS